jgi:hypothetical protein
VRYFLHDVPRGHSCALPLSPLALALTLELGCTPAICIQAAHGTRAQTEARAQQGLSDDHRLGEWLDHYERQHNIPFDIDTQKGASVRRNGGTAVSG